MKFQRVFPTNTVEKMYVRAGTNFGGAVSYIYMGECVGFESLLNKWARWEEEYAQRGFRTISLDDFVKAGGYGDDLSHLIGIKRESLEKPILHAQIYKNKYLGKIRPQINMESLMRGEIQTGNYTLPSTKE